MKAAIRVLLCAFLATGLCAAQQGSSTAKPRQRTTATKKAQPAPAVTENAKSAEAPAGMPTEQTVNAFLKTMFGYDPNLVFKVAEIKPAKAAGLSEVAVVVSTPQGQQLTRFFVSSDGHHAIMGDIMPFGPDPFAEARTQLQKHAFGPSKGPEDAAVTIVEFGDLQCPACKQAQPTIEKLLTEVPNSRLIFQSFPLEELHPWAGRASRYSDCLLRTKSNDAAWTFIGAVYAHQGEITESNVDEKLNRYITMSGGEPAAIAACAKAPETEERMKRGAELAQELGVTGTPTLFVNGRSISSINNASYDMLKAVVEFMATHQTGATTK